MLSIVMLGVRGARSASRRSQQFLTRSRATKFAKSLTSPAHSDGRFRVLRCKTAPWPCPRPVGQTQRRRQVVEKSVKGP